MNSKPAGPIRPGQKKPYRKCTKEEFDDRVEFVAGLFSENPLIHRGEINKLVKKNFDIEFRQSAVYITCAKKLLRQRAEMPKEDAKTIVVNALLSVLGTGKNVVQAAGTLCEIYGLFAPRRAELSGPEGGPIATKEENPLKGLSVERLRQLALGENGEAKREP